MDGSIIQGSSLEVIAGVRAYAEADADAPGGGIVAGNGGIANATSSPLVGAAIGDNVHAAGVQVSGIVTVRANAEDLAIANGWGLTVAAGAVGGQSATATADPDVAASIGDGSMISAGSITVEAQSHDQSSAIAEAAGVGAIVATGAQAAAAITPTVEALAGKPD